MSQFDNGGEKSVENYIKRKAIQDQLEVKQKNELREVAATKNGVIIESFKETRDDELCRETNQTSVEYDKRNNEKFK